MNNHSPLFSLKILVTRSAYQALSLRERLEKAGGDPLLFPIFEIVPLDLTEALQNLGSFMPDDILIFTSPNAVFQAATHFKSLMGARVLAMGPGTGQALIQLGILKFECAKPPYNSESLLKLPLLQAVHRKRVVLVKGRGGRELLAEALLKRGAFLQILECYERKKSDQDLNNFWQTHNPEFVITTSNELLKTMHEMVTNSNRRALLNTPLLVISERARTLAADLGFKTILMITEYDEDAILNTIIHWKNSPYDRK